MPDHEPVAWTPPERERLATLEERIAGHRLQIDRIERDLASLPDKLLKAMDDKVDDFSESLAPIRIAVYTFIGLIVTGFVGSILYVIWRH